MRLLCFELSLSFGIVIDPVYLVIPFRGDPILDDLGSDVSRPIPIGCKLKSGFRTLQVRKLFGTLQVQTLQVRNIKVKKSAGGSAQIYFRQ